MTERGSYWLGVASHDHVLRALEGGFCQLGHGKEAPIRRLASGDWLAYYSPKNELGGGEPVQSFTAIGRIEPGDAYQANMDPSFHPWRRNVAWKRAASEAPIRPLLETLELTRGRRSWGIVFRRSLIAVSQTDFRIIAAAMAVAIH